MKTFFLYFMVLLLNKQDVIYYRQALPLILSSKEFAEYNVNEKNYNVSSEIISFSNFDSFFKEELKVSFNHEITSHNIVKIENELLKLNVRKCSKMKIFFSEQKNNIFFVEVFEYKKERLSYDNRPIFGMSKVYMFKIQNQSISLVRVKDFHYN